MGSNRSPGFTVRTDVRNGVARLALAGELDMAVAPTLEVELSRVENDGVSSLLLDLGELTFMDSTGLHLLLRATRRAKDNGHDLAIVGVGGVPRRVLEVTGTERVLIDDASALPVIKRFSQGEVDAADTSAARMIGDDVG
jgi:anti-sigma B factor antagonist